MFSFLLPKAVKQGRQFAQDARKVAAYKRDLWDDATKVEFASGIASLEKANTTRDAAEIESAARTLDQLCQRHLPKVENAGWRENVEVFLVAIVIALAVRTYFLQPFTIPTGSMLPTLNGILAFPTSEEPPNVLVRFFHTAAFGRTWINTIAKDDEIVGSMTEVKRFRFFTYTQVQTSGVQVEPDGSMRPTNRGNTYLIHAPMGKLTESFGVNSTRIYRRGEAIARGYINTGDHVFVDKFSYHFRKPTRGEVFVFNTQNVPTIERRLSHRDPYNNPEDFATPSLARIADQQRTKVDMERPSQFYIKRLVGLPGDELRIDAPAIFINGQPPVEPAIRRVSVAQDGYGGYAFGFPSFLMPILRAPTETYTLPPKRYFALGDNSYHSSDSRDWGAVPEQNLMGHGVFVYWPFGAHWGRIR